MSTQSEKLTFKTLRDEISKIQSKRISLESMLDTFKGHEAFDKSDEKQVEKVLLNVCLHEKFLSETLRHRIEIDETKLQALKAIVKTRTDILAQFDNKTDVFAEFPEIADSLAKKQHDLNHKVQEITNMLEDNTWQKSN